MIIRIGLTIIAILTVAYLVLKNIHENVMEEEGMHKWMIVDSIRKIILFVDFAAIFLLMLYIVWR